MAIKPTGYKQSTPMPTTKVMAGAIVGALITIIVWVLNTFNILPEGTQIPGEIASALTTVIAFFVSYFVPPSGKDQVVLEQ